MISRVRNATNRFPRQFWLITAVMMLAWLFHSLMWSYLLIFICQRLGLPLSSVSGLMMVNAATSMVTTFLGGAIADRFGRKGVMVFSLVFSGVGWYFFRLAGTLPVFAILMAVNGATTPLYRLAADSMVADLIPPDKRLDAYSMMRMGNNLGVALGPAIGGFLASVSYNISFTVIGIGLAAVGIITALLAKETRPGKKEENLHAQERGGYLRIFKDKMFLTILSALTLNRICTSTLWLMLAAYAKQNYALSERIYGFIPTTNAVMVILFQIVVTQQVRKTKSESAMALGALIYAISILSVAFSNGFWGFWLCMVASTVGEMILVPTTTTFISHLAPEDMRARYMSMYTLASGIGTGLGPLLGGFMEKSFGARSMWYSAGAIGFAGFLVFLIVIKLRRNNEESRIKVIR